MAAKNQPSPATVATTAPGRKANGPKTERITGAQAIVRTLEDLGTDLVFGIPGGAVLPLYDALHGSTKLRHVLTRHEQGAGHAAEGYAQASGKVGVMIATSGPGATNLVTALADANLDSVPVVAITGQVGSNLLGTDAFQEADIRGMTMPITKHNYIVTNAQEIPEAIAAAFHLASTGRPGPVLIDIPKDIQISYLDYSFPPRLDLPGYKPVTVPHPRQISQAVKMIAKASKPVLYIGGGVIKANAHRELMDFVEYTGIPVVTTLMALGAFPDSHPLHLGMPGMHGTVPAVAALQRADLIINIGARFDDRVTGDLETFAPYAQVIHADIDPAEVGKLRAVDVPIVGDAREVLSHLLRAYKKNSKLGLPEMTDWLKYLNTMVERFPRGWEPTEDGKLNPQFVIEKLSETVGPDAIYCAGVGQHQMWSAQFIDFEKPRSWINSGGAGTMGYAVPAALGAKAAMPDKEVWAVDGDGCFQMTNQELTTATMEGFPIKVAVINNGNLGMVRQWQTLFFNKNYSNTKLRDGSRYLPDFVKLAESMGCESIRVTCEEEVVPAIKRAQEINDRPVVIDFIVGEDAQVWPMIGGGASNEEVQYAMGLRPLFDEEESAAESPAAINEAIEEA
ncbi:acetolactate synthase large subunit [Corynebacterium phocae]|uniref:acetolactate synthase large subunit n=1 Tax=Corynebacterium phocae TaxID=161895 RepID=UPI000951AD8B|nr:acetolactate synthase large subunit [Corynebacterium phocae]KAA8723030.1 acetolactate synthase large subunit [Corynebacterium phocae]